MTKKTVAATKGASDVGGGLSRRQWRRWWPFEPFVALVATSAAVAAVGGVQCVKNDDNKKGKIPSQESR